MQHSDQWHVRTWPAPASLVLLLTLALVAGGVYTAVSFLQRSETLVSERCTAAVGAAGRRARHGPGRQCRPDHGRRRPARAAAPGRQHRAGHGHAGIQAAEHRPRRPGRARTPADCSSSGPPRAGAPRRRSWTRTTPANAFYDALVKIPGYESLEITDAAQRVQRSAYPDAYAQHEDMARSFASGADRARPRRPCTAPCAPPRSRATRRRRRPDWPLAYGDVARQHGRQDPRAGRRAATQAWSVAQWAVANAKALSVTEVDVAGRSWNRQDTRRLAGLGGRGGSGPHHRRRGAGRKLTGCPAERQATAFRPASPPRAGRSCGTAPAGTAVRGS